MPFFNKLSVLAATLLLAGCIPAFAQSNGSASTKFNLNAETDQYNPGPAYPDPVAYPAPRMVGQQAHVAPPPQHKPLHANVQQNTVKASAVVQQAKPAAPPPGVLPGQILGRWLVLGQRAEVQARPEFQSGIDGIFTMSNSQMWEIAGQPGAYSMNSSSGVSQVQVGQCTADTAFIRYQHQVKNTMAQEAIVMQLSPDGKSFQGLQSISIVKPGEPQPRAVVKYRLMGRRQ